LSRRESIPLDRQLHLAILVIQRVPQRAREGHQLRGQTLAAICVSAGDHVNAFERALWA
jgi:hypothetical protein